MIRLARIEDAERLTELVVANRVFLAPWMPRYDEDYYTLECQKGLLASALEAYDQGRSAPYVVLDGHDEGPGQIVGRVSLNSIIRGAFQSCSVAYWIDRDCGGRGLASAAVRDIVRVAFEEFELHRVQGETLLHNAGSQRVLERNGFVRYGIAPAYLKIDGRWQDHALYQLVRP